MAHERIVTRCPECGTSNLFIGTGGHLICGLIGCKCPSVADSIGALKADNTRLRASLAAAEEVKATLLNALEQSIHLQSHYAVQLNTYDAGERIGFASAADWLERLAVVDTPQETKQDVCPKCKGSGFETVQPDTEEE